MLQEYKSQIHLMFSKMSPQTSKNLRYSSFMIWNQSLSDQGHFKTVYGWPDAGGHCVIFFLLPVVMQTATNHSLTGLEFHSHKSGIISMHHKAVDRCFLRLDSLQQSLKKGFEDSAYVAITWGEKEWEHKKNLIFAGDYCQMMVFGSLIIPYK